MIKTSFETLARSVDQEADPRKVIKSAVAIVPHQASRGKANARDLGRQAIANPGMEGRKEGKKGLHPGQNGSGRLAELNRGLSPGGWGRSLNRAGTPSQPAGNFSRGPTAIRACAKDRKGRTWPLAGNVLGRLSISALKLRRLKAGGYLVKEVRNGGHQPKTPSSNN